ncbi:hypothetical protein Tco_1408951 [Tanacetum coccineum]
MFSLNNSSAMHEKTSPRSCLRWQPTSRIFKIVGLRWVPTRKLFASRTTKFDSEPLNGSNDAVDNHMNAIKLLILVHGTFNQVQIRWQKRIFLHLNLQEEMNRSFIARSGYRLERETFSWIYRSCRRILSSAFQLIFRISVALAGPNPEHMHDVFLATNYPKVHESLKHTTKEHVHLENPPSSSRTLSSMKNLEDNFTFGDQVINDKSQEDELGKTTVESEVESMVIVPIQQASSSAPPLNTPVIDLSSPKLVSPSCQEPFITTSTTNTCTTTEQNRS